MTQPRLRVTSVSIAAPDPRELAAFYSRLLGTPVTTSERPRPGCPAADGWAQIRPDFQPQEDVRVMLDPVGHPFCSFLGERASAARPG